eukprot:5766769-Pyramimonas_sp.AAC.1
MCPGRPARIAAAVSEHPVRTPMWCRENATPAMPWTTVTHSGRPQGPPRAHPLWCRQNATPAVPWTTVVLCCAVLC